MRASVETATAWTGQAVPLIITLYSPGPFAGTASFDLPELPQTAIVASGSPLVGSEDVDGESFITQRHEFRLYTQRSGVIVVPSFRVRFAGKKTFLSDPEPMEGVTPELRFQSKRPPGTESMGVVVTATTMDIRQAWNPEPGGEFSAGDVVRRTVVQNAEGTTAMTLPQASGLAPDGVRVYAGEAEVEDIAERSEYRAQRTDTIQYQFQQAGTFSLPELSFVWWDPALEKLRRETLPGLTINVSMPTVSATPPAESRSPTGSIWVILFAGALTLAWSLWLLRKPLRQLAATWKAHNNRPETLAARRLRAACTAADASASYSAFLAWAAALHTRYGISLEQFLGMQENRDLRKEWQVLSRHLFGSKPPTATWTGARFWTKFCESRTKASGGLADRRPSVLPPLNPITISGQRAV